MKFLRLHDPLLRVLFENEDIVAVDKPYGIDTHTNESKKGNEAYIVPGLIEVFESQLKKPLHIIHRLDKTTSGVIVFGKSLDSAKKYQQFFRNRETAKTYLFITGSQAGLNPAASKKINSNAILHKGAELDASTEFQRLSVNDRYSLWEAKPHTGRNHQIRIHASELDLALLGDVKYGGEKFPFLCLHNRRIAFPNGLEIESSPPPYFTDLNLLSDRDLAVVLHEVDRRNRLYPERENEAIRLVQCLRESPNREFYIDQLGPFLSVIWQKSDWSKANEETFKDVSRVLDQPILVRLTDPKFKEPNGRDRLLEVSGRMPLDWKSKENGLSYELRTDVGQSLGFFTDQRTQRNWVRENSRDKRVLNLYSYTGGYSVSAAAGGAAEVTSVDSAKSALNWSRKNFELNQLSIDAHLFLNRDVLLFLEQATAKKQKFDLVICDAPSFSRGEKGLFKIEEQLGTLVNGCLRVLAEDGILLLSVSSEKLFVDDIRKVIQQAQTNLGIGAIDLQSLQNSLDLELPGERPSNKSFLVQIRKA